MNCYVVLYKDASDTIFVGGVHESKKDAQKEANTYMKGWVETRFFRLDHKKYKRKQRRIDRWNHFITRLLGKLMR